MRIELPLCMKGRHLPDKAIDLVDEACANVRVQLDSQPEEIDNLERKRIQLEVELHALEKEKDKSSKARLVDVGSVNLEPFLIDLFRCLCVQTMNVDVLLGRLRRNWMT